jgi:LemA protein
MTEIIVIVLIMMLLWSVSIYNRLVRDNNRVQAGWSDIDVQLKLRHTLVPNLVAATKQYASYEQAVLTTVTELRTQSQNASTMDERSSSEEQLGNGLQKLIALVEQYPDLKANENFTKLQDELVEVEEKIQYARRYYNGAVRNFNIAIEQFPNLIIARLFKYQPSSFFQLESDEMRKSIKVK